MTIPQAVLLSTYAIGADGGGKRIRDVKRLRLAETRFRSPQLALFELGPDDWLLYLRAPEFAPRHRPPASHPAQLPLFPHTITTG